MPTVAVQVKMQGTGNFPQCEKLIMRIFNKDAPCLVTQCSLPRLLSGQGGWGGGGEFASGMPRFVLWRLSATAL